MTDSKYGETFESLVRRLDPGSRLHRTWPLHGGVSARVTAVEVERPDGEIKRLVVRQHGAADLRVNRHVAADEFKLLRALHSVGLPVPAPYHVDESDEVFSSPYIIVEYVDGTTDPSPADAVEVADQLAACLVRIHRVDRSSLDLSFLPRQDDRCSRLIQARPERLDQSLDERRIRDALDAVWPLQQRNRSVLLHGDFWPGNVLWKNGRLAAVVDWEDAAIGDQLADLGNSRLELLWAYGVDAMHRFTERYLSTMTIDVTNLPYWDLCAALRPISKIGEWALDDATERRMRELHRWFVNQAMRLVHGQGSS